MLNVFSKEPIILLIIFLGVFFLVIKILNKVFIFIGKKINKLRRGKPDSICEYCREGEYLHGKAHIIDDRNGLRIVMCNEHLQHIREKFKDKSWR